MRALQEAETEMVVAGTKNLAAAVIGGAEIGAEIGTAAEPGGGTLIGAIAGAGLGFIGWCAAAGAGLISP